MKRWNFVGLVLLALNGCVDHPIDQTNLPAIKTVGIVSALGDEVSLQAIGITVFGNSFTAGTLPGFNLDDYVTEQITSALAAKYDVRPVSFDRANFQNEKFGDPYDHNLLFHQRPLGDVIRADISPQGLDAYVVVLSARLNFSMANQAIVGRGVLKRGFHCCDAFALYRIYVVDGHQLSAIGAVSAPANEGDLLPTLGGPHREVDSSFWVESVEALSDAQRQRLVDQFKDLMKASLPRALKELKLL